MGTALNKTKQCEEATTHQHWLLARSSTCHCGASNWCAVVGRGPGDSTELQSNDIKKEKCLPRGPCWLCRRQTETSRKQGILWELGNVPAVSWALSLLSCIRATQSGWACSPAQLSCQGHTASQFEDSQKGNPGVLGQCPALSLLNPVTSHDLQLAVNQVTKATVALDVEIITAVSIPPTCRVLYNLKDLFIIIILHGPYQSAVFKSEQETAVTNMGFTSRAGILTPLAWWPWTGYLTSLENTPYTSTAFSENEMK